MGWSRRPEWIFIILYTHGAMETNAQSPSWLAAHLAGSINDRPSTLERSVGFRYHHVTAREWSAPLHEGPKQHAAVPELDPEAGGQVRSRGDSGWVCCRGGDPRSRGPCENGAKIEGGRQRCRGGVEQRPAATYRRGRAAFLTVQSQVEQETVPPIATPECRRTRPSASPLSRARRPMRRRI